MPQHTTLETLGACQPARAWAAGYATLREAWEACDQADWMLWLVAHTLPRGRLVEVSIQIARTIMRHVPTDEDRPRLALEAAEAWTRGAISDENVRSAAAHAYAAGLEACAATAAAAAAAASYAAAVAVADSAATAAAYAANVTAAVAPRADALQYDGAAILQIVRREIAWAEVEAALPREVG